MRIAVNIWTTAEGGFKAQCPALPGCMASGRSNEEAAGAIEQAVRGYLASLNVPEADRADVDLLPVEAGR